MSLPILTRGALAVGLVVTALLVVAAEPNPKVAIDTGHVRIVIEVDVAHAPVTAGAH